MALESLGTVLHLIKEQKLVDQHSKDFQILEKLLKIFKFLKYNLKKNIFCIKNSLHEVKL